MVGDFRKDLTVLLDLEGDGTVSVVQVLKTVRMLCGGVLGCRQLESRKFEVTVSNQVAKERLMEGFRMGQHQGVVRELVDNELLVSFLNLPVYVTDEEILEKLRGWGVQAVSDVRRRMWPGTGIADGTRLVRVRFTDSVQSLPYSAKFLTASGHQFFRVIHDRQVRVCRQCLQAGHLMRECPDFLCLKCGQQGHYARECSTVRGKCKVCLQPAGTCVCRGSESEGDTSCGEDGAEPGAGARGMERTGAGGKMPAAGDVQRRGLAKGGGEKSAATPEPAGGARDCAPSPAPEESDRAEEEACLVTGGGELCAATPEPEGGSALCGAAPVEGMEVGAWPGGSGACGGVGSATGGIMDALLDAPPDPVDETGVKADGSPILFPAPAWTALPPRAAKSAAEEREDIDSPAVVPGRAEHLPPPLLAAELQLGHQLARSRSRGVGKRRGKKKGL